MSTRFGVTLTAPNTSIGEKVWTLWQLRSIKNTTGSSLKPMEWKLFYTSLQLKRMKLRIGSGPMATRPSTTWDRWKSILCLAEAYITKSNTKSKRSRKSLRRKNDRGLVSRQAISQESNLRKKRKRKISGRSYRRVCRRQIWVVASICQLQTYLSIREERQWSWSAWSTVKNKTLAFRILRWDVWALLPS